MKYLNDISYKDCAGKVCKSLNSGDFKILTCNGARNVEIQFLKTGYKTTVYLGSIRNGYVKDRYLPSVYGIGIIGDKYPSRIGGFTTKEYMLWMDMLKRCYSDTNVCDSSKKKYPTYEGCEVSENFKSYEYFYDWCQNQIGFGVKGWHLDKDLLIKGNKVYSESTCVFIPSAINSLLIKSDKIRGKHPIGVYWRNTKKAFVAQVNKSKGKPEYLGSFKTELEAFNAYKEVKENYLKEIANKWKSQIDIRAYEALMNYTVDIDD